MALSAGVHRAALFLVTAYALPVIGGHAVRNELLGLLLMAGGAGNEGLVDILAGEELLSGVHSIVAGEAVLGITLHLAAVAVRARSMTGFLGGKPGFSGLFGLGFEIALVHIAGMSLTVPFLHGEGGNMVTGGTGQLVLAHVLVSGLEIAAEIHAVAGLARHFERRHGSVVAGVAAVGFFRRKSFVVTLSAGQAVFIHVRLMIEDHAPAYVGHEHSARQDFLFLRDKIAANRQGKKNPHHTIYEFSHNSLLVLYTEHRMSSV